MSLSTDNGPSRETPRFGRARGTVAERLRAEAAVARSDVGRRVAARALAVAIVAAGLADLYSTNLALSTGHAYEANPFVAWIQEQLGAYWSAPKMAVHVLLAAMILWYPNMATLIGLGFVTVLVFVVSASNYSIYRDVQHRNQAEETRGLRDDSAEGVVIGTDARQEAPSEARALRTARSVAELREAVSAWRAEGRTVALTPTMGALHDGHVSLVREAKRRADRVVASIFVNPTQFGAGEDFESYPRDEARDAALLAAEACDLLYAPTPAEMYPPGFATEVRVVGLTDALCGANRPGHFDGVALVVSKLLSQAQADIALFGEKDWQQLVVIRRLARDLDIPTRILGAPTLRAPDGLALSSRNAYLTDEERRRAPALNRALRAAATRILAGDDPREAERAARAALTSAGFGTIDYVEAREAESLAPLAAAPPETSARMFAAAHLGRARLIDNVPIAPDGQVAPPEAPREAAT